MENDIKTISNINSFVFDNKEKQMDTINLDYIFILEKRGKYNFEELDKTGEYINVPLKIRKVDKDNNSIPIISAEVEYLNKYLFNTVENKNLEFQNKIYKGTFNKVKHWSKNYNEGYVEVVFNMLNYNFSNIYRIFKKIDGTKIIKINNKSNAVEQLETLIYIKSINNKSNVTIENLTNRDKVTISNVANNKIKIDNIKLNKGNNEIKITSNNLIEITIERQEIFKNESEVLKWEEVS